MILYEYEKGSSELQLVYELPLQQNTTEDSTNSISYEFVYSAH